MLKEDIKKMLDTRKAPFKMELKGDDLTPFIVEQIVEMFLHVAEWIEGHAAEYTEVYSCGCYYDQEYDPCRSRLEKAMSRILKEKEMIEKLEFTIFYSDRLDCIGAPSIYITRKEICEECLEMPRRVAEIKETMRPDSIFQNSIYSHGLATGFGSNQVSAETAEDNLMTLLGLRWEETEICCSWKTQQIGGFGMFIRGEVTLASNRDLWSYVGINNSRDFNVDEFGKFIIDRRDELRLGWQDHTEFFVKPKELIAFWAKDWFIRDVPGGRELVEKLQGWGYKVYVTRRRHR